MLIEDNGKRLLIDPGDYAFTPIGKMEPEQLGSVDLILITHEHGDHFAPDMLKRILIAKQARIVSHERINERLKKEKMQGMVMRAGEMQNWEGFSVEGIEAPHGATVLPTPENLGFLIGGRVFHPGDSLMFQLKNSIEVLLLPIAGPWLTQKSALDTALHVQPKMVIPIHDAMIKEFSIRGLYARSKDYLAQAGIAFHPLPPGESLEI